MKIMTFILTFISLLACSQLKQANQIATQRLPERIIYVSKPNPNDSLCISDINRAKKDIAKGKIVFTQRVGFLFGNIRYETELRELCKQNGLVFDFDVMSDVVFEGETQGCYGNYMDKIIIEKYGVEFKENLHKKADSLFLARTNLENKSVEYWDCDERPRLPTEIKRTTDEFPCISVADLDIKESKGEYGWPFIDLNFMVEKDSTISGFYLRNFVSQLEENKIFKEKLIAIAVDYIKTNYPVWIPGKIKGIPVRTINNVRIVFIKKEK
jgi:hypothetical protein